jgi:hypothetical protein
LVRMSLPPPLSLSLVWTMQVALTQTPVAVCAVCSPQLRTQYWSQSDLEGFTGTTRTNMYSQAAEKVPNSQVETIDPIDVTLSVGSVTPATSLGQEREKDMASDDTQIAAQVAEVDLQVAQETPSKADLLNEFNRVSPLSLSEAERYEERITQLESAPLPCIDAVTGLVHIVGETE